MVVDTLPFTEFIQHPTAATGRLETAQRLRLRRRDAEDLIVMHAARVDREDNVLDFVGRLLALMVRQQDGREVIERLLPELLPWVRFLPEHDRQTLVEEFVDVAEAAVSLSNLAPVAQLLTECRHTAEVHADPELHALLSTPRGEDHGPAAPPGAEDHT
jgi:hypothetical protein